MIKKIIIPPYLFKGIKHNELAFPKRYRIFGFDTETVNGLPYTLQFYDGKKDEIIYVNKNNVLDKFLNFMKSKIVSGIPNVVYAHNLLFDISVLLIKYHKLFLNRTTLKIKYKDVDIEFVIGKVVFGYFNFKKLKKKITMLDTGAFFVGQSLEYVSKELGLTQVKMKKPSYLGLRKPKTKDEKKYFEQYAKNDAVVVYNIGQWIFDSFRKYNTRICVSSPQFAMRVFRHYFIKDSIAFPPYQVIQPSILSYHGGKNGYYLNGVSIIKNCYEIDIISAYPYAMTQIPNMVKGEYKFYDKYTDEYEGIWCITGKVNNCKYPVIFTHDFLPVYDYCNNIWITSYELKQALKYNEIELEKCFGYVWIPDPNYKYNPFKEFVNHFYKMKDSAKTKSERLLAKRILNSLYGKTIQTIELDDENEKEKYKDEIGSDYKWDKNKNKFVETKLNDIFLAGGMFHPFIATLITGFTRAYLHELEHKYQAIHSSTDSVKTTIKPVEINELGGIKIECYGTCIILRNKLYIHYDQNGNIKKYALHGFTGTVQDLNYLIQTKYNKYKVKHIFKVREALRQGKIPLKQELVEKELLNVDFNNITYL